MAIHTKIDEQNNQEKENKKTDVISVGRQKEKIQMSHQASKSLIKPRIKTKYGDDRREITEGGLPDCVFERIIREIDWDIEDKRDKELIEEQIIFQAPLDNSGE